MLGPGTTRGKVKAVGNVELYVVSFEVKGDKETKLALRTDVGGYFWLYPEPIEANLKAPATWIVKEIESFRDKPTEAAQDTSMSDTWKRHGQEEDA